MARTTIQTTPVTDDEIAGVALMQGGKFTSEATSFVPDDSLDRYDYENFDCGDPECPMCNGADYDDYRYGADYDYLPSLDYDFDDYPSPEEIEEQRLGEIKMSYRDIELAELYEQIDEAWGQHNSPETLHDARCSHDQDDDHNEEPFDHKAEAADEIAQFHAQQTPQEVKRMKPEHRTNRERGRRKQKAKIRRSENETQRRRDNSSKQLRKRGEYIKREQSVEGWDFTNGIVHYVRGAAAGGIVCNPETKPTKRHISPGPKIARVARPIGRSEGTTATDRDAALAQHRKVRQQAPVSLSKGVEPTVVIRGNCLDDSPAAYIAGSMSRTYSVWS